MSPSSDNRITDSALAEFEVRLREEGKSNGTVRQYMLHLRTFRDWLDGEEVTKPRAEAWLQSLRESGLAPNSLNIRVGAVNSWCLFAGLRFRLKQDALPKQAQVPCRTLTRAEYESLRNYALSEGKPRLARIMDTLAATGLRISQLPQVTVEAVQQGTIDAQNGPIPLPPELRTELLAYAKQAHRTEGPLFVTAHGKPPTRGQTWTQLKTLARRAGLNPDKVSPKSFRYLFAREFYQTTTNPAALADALGNTSVPTVLRYIPSGEKE